MKKFTRIKIEKTHIVEFLFASDLESELHPGEDPGIGVHTGFVLEEMLKEAKSEGDFCNLPHPDFILSNGDENSRFDRNYDYVWNELENLIIPCYHVFGNQDSLTFNYYADKWKEYFGYEETYYAWEYTFYKTTVTFIVLDTWGRKDKDGRLINKWGSGKQKFRDEEKEWFKKILDQAAGLVIVFAHAHLWPPDSRCQDNEVMDELVNIVTGTYEKNKRHKPANVFFTGGHHKYPGCTRVDGVYFIDPLAGIHRGYARVSIDPEQMKMDYIGRLNEKSYIGLELHK